MRTNTSSLNIDFLELSSKCVLSIRDEAEVTSTFKIKMSRDGEVCTLQMAGVTQKMSGDYKCVAVNTVGEATCAAKVTIMGERYNLCCRVVAVVFLWRYTSVGLHL